MRIRKSAVFIGLALACRSPLAAQDLVIAPQLGATGQMTSASEIRPPLERDGGHHTSGARTRPHRHGTALPRAAIMLD